MKINVFGMEIKIEKKDDLMVNEGCRGILYPSQCQMFLDKSLPPADELHTIIHEMVHAVIFRTGIDQTKISEDLEEILCENVATAVVENWKRLATVLDRP